MIQRMGTLVTSRLDHSIATITLDDGKVNVLSPDMLGQVNAALDEAADAAVVVLTGRPGVFSAGFDLRVLQARDAAAEGMIRGGFELAARLLTFPAPVLIACTGHAIAMASFLLLSADYRIGADGPYKITANEVAIGMTIPVAAIEICRQRLSPAHLSRALTLAETFPPPRRRRSGSWTWWCPGPSWPPRPRPPRAAWPRWTGPPTRPPSSGSAARPRRRSGPTWRPPAPPAGLIGRRAAG